MIERIGGFDEVFGFGYWEDHDYSVRAINAGYQCIRALNTFVDHVRNATVKSKMDNDEWNSVFENNKKIFEKKWGRPKRVIITVNWQDAINKKRLEDRFNKAVELARKQNKVYIFTPVLNLKIPRHTNIKLVRCVPLFFGLDVKLRLLFNKRRKSSKHYNEPYIGARKIIL